MQVDRCLVRRFATACLAVLGLLAAFYALLLVRTGVSRGVEDQGWAAVVRVLLLGLLRSVDVMLAVAAPTAVLHALLGLRRRGIFLTFMAAGLTPSRLRRTILALAVALTALTVGAHEVAARASAPEPGGLPLWHVGPHWAWLVPGPDASEDGDLILFESQGLGVWRACGIRPPPAGAEIDLDSIVSLHGEEAAPAVITGPQPPRPTFRSLPPSRWWRASPDTGILLGHLLQVLVVPLLFLLCAYLALTVRRKHLPFAWLAFLLLLPAVAAGMIAVVVILRHSPAWGAAAALAYLAAIGGSLVGLDRYVNRRGLRL